MELEEDSKDWRVMRVEVKKGSGVTLMLDTDSENWWRWDNMGRSIWEAEWHGLALWKNYDYRVSVFYLGQN